MSDAKERPFNIPRRGLMLGLSSPSGAGKSTLSLALLEQNLDLTMSVSFTTRPPRPGEVDGREYFFVEQGRFDEMVANGEFIEYATVLDNSYGTPRVPVEEVLAAGRDVLFDVDWQGTQQLREFAERDLISIFILPPSTKELERRLQSRAQDPQDVVRKRMAKASSELSHWAEYDYIIVNVDIDESVAQAQAILDAERLKRDRRVGLGDFVRGMRDGQ